MADTHDPPHFPAPRTKEPYREPEVVVPAPVAPAPELAHTNDAPASQAPLAPAPKIEVTRAEPPPSSRADGAPEKLSKEEVAALLAVSEAGSGRSWVSMAKRGGIIVVPTGLISTGIQLAFGWWGFALVIGVALWWITRPMLKQNRDGWS